MAFVDYSTGTWQCDGCGKEQRSEQARISPYDPVIPDWAITIGKDGGDQSFCSWPCAATYASKQVAGRPKVVTLCGSTKFWREFQAAGLRETMAGRIVLSIGAASGTDDEHFGNLPIAQYNDIKVMLDTLHLRKIDLCDQVLILNVGDYIGESTTRELKYARSLGRRVRWLEPSRHLLPGETVEP